MKNIWKIALMVAALMTSCSQPDLDELNPNEGANGKEIKFYIGNNRTTFFEGEGLGVNWEAGDMVSVRRFDASNTSEVRQRANFKVDNAGASSALTQTTTWNTISWLESGETYIQAYYPATNNASIASVAITLPNEQFQAAANSHSHIGDLMLMKTEPVKYTAPYPESVGLEFRNAYSIIELTLRGTQDKKISRVKLTSQSSGLTINSSVNVNLLTTFDQDDANGIKGLDDTEVLTDVTTVLSEPATLTPEGVKLYIVVLPGAHADGDIELTATATDGSVATATMGAITFMANKVYRPAVNLTFGEAEEGAAIATIKHTFTDDKPYGDPIVLVDGVQPILDRTYGIYNVPEEVKYLSVATINSASYPSINKIEALTGGSVYVMLGYSKLVSSGIHQYILDAGWEAITPATETKVAADFEEGQVYYDDKAGDAEVSGTWTIYKRTMAAGEEYDLTELSDLLGTGFQGIRPIAGEITNECIELPAPDGVPVKMDFSSLPDGWTLQQNFTGVLTNPIKGKIEMAVESTLTNKIELDFSYIDGGVAGSAYHKEKYLLMHMNGKTNPLSVGFPAMEGYKLTAVELVPLANQKVKPNICMSSTPAPGEATSVSGGFVQWNHANGNIVLNIANSVVNTPYYLYACGGDNTVRIQAITLYYEPAE